MDLSSLSLSTNALHGVCFATKTSGPTLRCNNSGLDGVKLFLLLDTALARRAAPFGDAFSRPDFFWLNTALDRESLSELAPASYCTALLCLRYAATLPWRVAGSGLLTTEARQLTLHSMKSTVLAAAAQLRLSKEIRQRFCVRFNKGTVAMPNASTCMHVHSFSMGSHAGKTILLASTATHKKHRRRDSRSWTAPGRSSCRLLNARQSPAA